MDVDSWLNTQWEELTEKKGGHWGDTAGNGE